MTREGSLFKSIFEEVRRSPGITVEELAQKLGRDKYEVYLAVKELVDRRLVKVKRGDLFDPYRPTWTVSLYTTSEELPATARERVEPTQIQVTRGEQPSSPDLNVVITHPRPFKTNLNYLTFHECFDVLASRGKVWGIIGYINSQTLRSFLGEVIQRLKRPFELKLLAIEATGNLSNIEEILGKIGIKLEVKIPQWQREGHGVHAKFLTTDLYAYVGSHNLLFSSLTTNLEVGLLIRDPKTASLLRELFFELWNEIQ